jgi:hypothetical protein
MTDLIVRSHEPDFRETALLMTEARGYEPDSGAENALLITPGSVILLYG